jgi:hypothetical protein
MDLILSIQGAHENSLAYIRMAAIDFNADGYDDFLMNWVIDENNAGEKIKLGSNTLPQSQELIIDMAPWTTLINVYEREVSFGDFNGDGYSDMITSDHESGFWHGAAGLWLGGANPNGVYDLRITPPPVSPTYQFGWDTPAVGDFNGDGYDDVAFCAPQSQSGTTNYNGWVHVYAGNAQLADTTVENDDNVMQVVEPELSIFPNPFNPSTTISYSVPTDAEVSLTIYNARGQLVNTLVSEHKTKGNYQVVWQGRDSNGSSVASGLYFTRLVTGGKSISNKMLLMK